MQLIFFRFCRYYGIIIYSVISINCLYAFTELTPTNFEESYTYSSSSSCNSITPYDEFKDIKHIEDIEHIKYYLLRTIENVRLLFEQFNFNQRILNTVGEYFNLYICLLKNQSPLDPSLQYSLDDIQDLSQKFSHDILISSPNYSSSDISIYSFQEPLDQLLILMHKYLYFERQIDNVFDVFFNPIILTKSNQFNHFSNLEIDNRDCFDELPIFFPIEKSVVSPPFEYIINDDFLRQHLIRKSLFTWYTPQQIACYTTAYKKMISEIQNKNPKFLEEFVLNIYKKYNLKISFDL